jgi:Dolichyl-phosphate-mannose-protein mannosyltransferase
MSQGLKRLLPIAVVLAFSFSVKVWQLDQNPAGFFTDEAGIGYDAYLIGKTGADRYEEHWPLFFRGYACDGVSPYAVYLTTPFVRLLGLTEWSVRLTSVVGSTAELVIFYLLLCQFMPRFHALLGTLLLSISPWHFHLSRVSMDAYYTWPLMTALSYLFFVKGSSNPLLAKGGAGGGRGAVAIATSPGPCSVRRRTFLPIARWMPGSWFSGGRAGYYALAALCFGLTSYSYTPARMVTPLLFAVALLLVLFRRGVKVAALMAVVFLGTLTPALHYYLTNPCASGRFTATTGVSLGPEDLKHPRALFEKLRPQIQSWQQLGHTRVVAKYLAHFNSDFLFEKGDATYPGQAIQRHSIAHLGLLYPYQKWLMLAGMLWLLLAMAGQGRWELALVPAMVLLSPVPDSLTTDGTPFCTRSYLGVLPAHLLIAFGIDLVALCCWRLRPASIRRPAYVLGVAGLVLLIALSFQTLVRRFLENPLYTSGYWGWQAGPREVMRYFIPRNGEYDELILSGMFNLPHIFLKFYDLEGRCPHCQIGDLSSYDPRKKQLFALRPHESNPRTGHKVRLSSVYYPDGKVAFEIFTVDLDEPPGQADGGGAEGQTR